MSIILFIPPISSLHRYLIEARESVLAEKTEDEKVFNITPEHLSYNSIINYPKNAVSKRA